MRKNLHQKILKGKSKEQYINIVLKSCSLQYVVNFATYIFFSKLPRDLYMRRCQFRYKIFDKIDHLLTKGTKYLHFYS